VLDHVGAAGYDGWYVFEQDAQIETEPDAGAGPCQDVARSLEFLQQRSPQQLDDPRHRDVDDRVRTRLSTHGELVEVDPGDAEAIGRWLPQAVGIVARAAATIDAAVIDAATVLRVIGRSGVGVDRVDLAAATRRRIRWSSRRTPHAGVAEARSRSCCTSSSGSGR
jgi:hypothetical protein